MFVSDKLISLFEIAKDTVDDLRIKLATAQAENIALKLSMEGLKTTNEWMRHKINGLEVERTALFNIAYGTTLPAPEIVGAPRQTAQQTLAQVNFDHIDDEVARKLGIENLLS